MDIHEVVYWLAMPFSRVYVGYRGDHEILAGFVCFIAQLAYTAGWFFMLAQIARWTH